MEENRLSIGMLIFPKMTQLDFTGPFEALARVPNARVHVIWNAAGLLEGYEAATHWMSADQLPLFGARPVAKRIVVDRNRITGGGVTAGIDFALYLAGQLAGEEAARRIQLFLEYDPAPPFDSGSPRTASAPLVQGVRDAAANMLQRRWAASHRAADRLKEKA
jgi:cyclohexyl-isocyanide hydratase